MVNKHIYDVDVYPWVTPTNMAGFGKTCIVHTSDFANQEIHKNHQDWNTVLKFPGIINKGIVQLPI